MQFSVCTKENKKKPNQKTKTKLKSQLSWGLPSPDNNVKFSGKGSIEVADSIKSKKLEFLVKVEVTFEAATHFQKLLRLGGILIVLFCNILKVRT